MKIDKIYFMETFPTVQFGNQKLGMDITLEEGDQGKIFEAYERARDLVSESFKRLHPQLTDVSGEYKISDIQGFQPMPNSLQSQPIPTIDPRAQETAEIGIDDAKTIQDLEFYADIAVKYGLVEMYLAKKNALETMPFPK